jgi:hypothetical protein
MTAYAGSQAGCQAGAQAKGQAAAKRKTPVIKTANDNVLPFRPAA